jgi:hypothetical protein
MSKWHWIIIILLCLALTALGVWLATRPPYALGCVPSPADALATAQRASAANVDVLPASADMRAEFTPRSQGSQASCVSFAAAALASYQSGVVCSPAFIYNQRTTSNCQRDAGMSLYNALTIVTAKGDCLESLMPYNTNDICTQPSDAALADALTRKASGYAVLWGTQGTAALDGVRSYLAAGTPVLVAVPVYQSFYANAAGTIGVHAESERYYGGHAMLLVGYDAGGFWALNSWGPDWGHDGFAYLSNEFVKQEAWEGWIVNGLLGAQPTVLYVSVVDANGVKFDVTGGTVTLYRDNVEIITKEVVGGAQQFDTRIAATQYCVKPHPPAGYVSKTQAECMTSSDRLTFVWVPAATATATRTATPSKTPTTRASATATPTWTKTPTVTPTYTVVYPTATPTFTDPPTPPETTPTVPMPPTVGPSPTKCVSAYQQFSWDERATIINNGYRYIGLELEDGLDMFEDATLAIGNAQGFGAPLTRAYTVTGDNGEKIVCRGFAYAIVCQRTDDPCGGEFGVVDWSGPMMTLASGEWRVAP